MGFEQQQVSRWLAMATVRPKRSIAKEVSEKVASRKCLICGKPANGSRGLCVAHYLRFMRKLNSFPNSKRAAFEQEQIIAGRILASGSIRDMKTPDPFSSEVDE
jgi:NAD(P)H-hydrate repair Nnr-like enzyme with NAD(P)H-hydrate epimerase domain